MSIEGQKEAALRGDVDAVHPAKVDALEHVDGAEAVGVVENSGDS